MQPFPGALKNDSKYKISRVNRVHCGEFRKKNGVILTNVRLNALFVLLSGLCLIEVLSGKIVFADILEDKTVYDKKKAGENPVIPVK